MATSLEFTVLGVDKASATFDAVGQSAQSSADKISKSSEKASSSFDSIAEGSDNVASKGAQAAGALAGLGGVVGGPIGGAMVGLGSAMQIAADSGDLLNAAVEGGKMLLEGLKANTVVMTIAHGAETAAKGVATAAQWAWNAAMSANPIGLIIIGIAALIAGIVLLVTHWDKVKAAGAAAWDWIKGIWSGAVDWFKGLVDGIGKVFSGIADFITAPFRLAVSEFKSIWNSTVGGKGFSVPDWVPGLGGKDFKIPALATGGTIAQAGWALVGERGPEWAYLNRGDGVLPHNVNPPAAAQNGQMRLHPDDLAVLGDIVTRATFGASGVALAVDARNQAGTRSTRGRSW